MKALIYTHEFPPFLGGLATTSLKLANGISGSGIETVVLAPGYGRGGGEIRPGQGFRVIRIPGLGGKWIKAFPWGDILLGWFFLMITLRNEKPDIVLFITEEAEAAGGLIPRISFIPVVRVAGSGITTCFYGNRFLKRMMRLPMRRLYERAGVIVAVSRNTKELLRGIGVPGSKIRVIYNGVSGEMLTREPDENKLRTLREKYGIGERERVILTVARVLPRKGQDMVIRSLPLIREQFPDIVYLIVGEGRFIEKFRELAEDAGVAGSVLFTGGVGHDEITDYIDLSDVFVMPSRYWENKIEGLPNALIEASARGKPVVASKHGGSAEAVKEGVTGILVDPENTAEIADAVKAFLTDPEKARLAGEKGREMVREFHTEKGMIDNYVDVLERAVREKDASLTLSRIG